LFLIFLIIWIIISAKITVEIVIVGAIISALVLLFQYKNMNYRPTLNRKTPKKLLLWILYALTLITEIAKAAFSIIRIVMNPTLKITPCIIHFKTKLTDPTLRVVLANSITITPGSIIVELNDGQYSAHCLTTEVADTLENSIFEQQLLKIEKI